MKPRYSAGFFMLAECPLLAEGRRLFLLIDCLLRGSFR